MRLGSDGSASARPMSWLTISLLSLPFQIRLDHFFSMPAGSADLPGFLPALLPCALAVVEAGGVGSAALAAGLREAGGLADPARGGGRAISDHMVCRSP